MRLLFLFCALSLLIACKPKTKTETTQAQPNPIMQPEGAQQHVDPFPSPSEAPDNGDAPEKEVVYPGGFTNTQLLEKLQEARDEATPQQRQLIERQMEMVKTFDPKGMNEDMLQQVVEQSIALMLDYGKMHPDDYDIQLNVATKMFLSGFTSGNVGVDGEKYKQQGRQMSIDLVKRFPDKASAHAQLGFVYFRMGELDKSEATMNKCLELEPANGFCSAYLEEIKKLREEDKKS